ncbi:MAG: LysM peptidoglycan-binding domain-containing protein [Calditrichaeota bacterium]|nr:LysM peptidoglycan-binding domain-containing protein [Calditrichota bacterium]
MALLLLAGAGCSSSRQGASFDTKPATFRQVDDHLKSMREAYAAGNVGDARQALLMALAALDLKGLRTHAEKVAFLNDRDGDPRDGRTLYSYAQELLTSEEFYGTPTALAPLPGEDSDAAGKEPAQGEIASLDEGAVAAPLPEKVDDPRSSDGGFGRDLHSFIQDEIRKVAVHMGEDEDFELPEDFVAEIEFYIKNFQSNETYRKFFNQAIRRSRKYIPALREIFTEKGFPEEILYLAFIESGFNPTAYSRSHAAGMFQFIKSTGRLYGLSQGGSDLRYSPVKSAIACREYLNDLLAEFGSFTLALSSYNSGSGRTRQALHQLNDFRDRSFWNLREKTTVLHRETREYVPKIFAAIVAGKPGNAELFGFTDLPYPDPNAYRIVYVPRRMSLSTIAGAGKTEVRVLRDLNPDLASYAQHTPDKVIDYPLFVPTDAYESIKKYVGNFKPVKSATVASSGSTGKSSAPKGQYRVKRGDTLSEIARDHRTSIASLQSLNPFLASRGLRAGDLLTVDGSPTGSATTHLVRSGESLSTIASQYKVSVKQLQQWNNLKNTRIYKGQKLAIRSEKAGSSADNPQIARVATPVGSATRLNKAHIRQQIRKGENFTYRVGSGNTLGGIANMFGVQVAEIQNWNGIENGQLRVNQRISINSGRTFHVYKYKVRKGDTLESIARDFGTDLDTLCYANGLKENAGATPGKELTIYGFSRNASE